MSLQCGSIKCDSCLNLGDQSKAIDIHKRLFAVIANSGIKYTVLENSHCVWEICFAVHVLLSLYALTVRSKRYQ